MRAHAEAVRICSAHDERRDHLRTRQRMNEAVSLVEQRRRFQERWDDVCAMLARAG